MNIKLCAFADEGAKDFSAQLQILKQERIPLIELRCLDGINISDISLNDAIKYKKLLDDADIAVWSLGSPLGKTSTNEKFGKETAKADHLFKLAQIFETDRIRIFSFYTSEHAADRAKVLYRLRIFAGQAKNYGITLFHENEKGIYGDLPERVKDLLDHVQNLGCVFDPANYVQCGADAFKAAEILQGRIGYYHIKDAKFSDGEVVPAGEGNGQIKKIIANIAEDTVLSLEPHLMHAKNAEQIYGSRRAAFAVAAQALRKILKETGFTEDKESLIWKK